MFQEQINSPEIKKEKKIRTEEVQMLEPAVAELIDQMKDKIEEGKYSLIIGDESSGRIPTLLLNKVISRIYEEKGFEKPDIVFLAGNNQHTADKEYVEVLNNFINEHKVALPDEEHSALISTEYIMSGTRLTPLTQMLRARSVKYDIANASKIDDDYDDKYTQAQLENILGGKIYSTIDNAGIAFWRRPDFSGTSRKSLKDMEPLTKRFEGFEPKMVRIIREDIEIAAEKIFEEYKAKRNS